MAVFRKITESDIEKVAALENAYFTDAWTAKSIYETACQSQAFIVVAEEENEIAGYCIVYHVMDEGEIARIAVADTYRRQGIGCELLDTVCEIGKEFGLTRLLLEVRESNEGARGFYRAYGFAEDGLRKNFYEMPKEHAVLMSKQIG